MTTEQVIPATPSDPVEALIDLVRTGQRLGPDKTLRGAMLIDRDLSGTNLAGVDLRGADLSRANLTKANLVGARLEGTVLFGAQLDQAELLQADLRGANLSEVSAQGAGFGRANLEGADCFNAKLAGATFTQANLRDTDLRTADLTGARVRECCLRGADLSRSTLRGVDFRSSDVTGASFEGADLREGKLGGLRGAGDANWINSDIANVDFCGAYLVRRQILDQNYLHEFRRQNRTTELVYWIWWVTSDCGRSFVRWCLWTVFLALVFAGLYEFVDIDFGKHPTILSSIYYSVVTLTTLGYGDVVPASLPAQILAMIEVVLGYVMLGGLLSIFANKMARRAD